MASLSTLPMLLWPSIVLRVFRLFPFSARGLRRRMDLAELERRVAALEHQVAGATPEHPLRDAVAEQSKAFWNGLSPQARAVAEEHAKHRHVLELAEGGWETLVGAVPRMQVVAAQLEAVEALKGSLEAPEVSPPSRELRASHAALVREVAVWDDALGELFEHFRASGQATSAQLLRCDALLHTLESERKAMAN
jgi:hypothetical protein